MSRSTAQPRGECQAKPPHRAVWAVWAGGSTAPSGGEGPARGHATGDRESRCDLDSRTRPHARPHTRAPARRPPQCRAWLGLGRLGPGQGLGPRPHRRHGPATRLLSPACQAPAQTTARAREGRLQSTVLCAARRRGAAGGAPSPDVAKGSAPSTPCRRRSPTRRRDEQTALQVPSPRPAQATSPCSAGLGPAGPRTLGLGQRACSPSLERLAGPAAARTSPPSSPEELRRNKRQLQHL